MNMIILQPRKPCTGNGFTFPYQTFYNLDRLLISLAATATEALISLSKTFTGSFSYLVPSCKFNRGIVKSFTGTVTIGHNFPVASLR
jgi:hypothetical protein